jgi:hypothetical protein
MTATTSLSVRGPHWTRPAPKAPDTRTRPGIIRCGGPPTLFLCPIVSFQPSAKTLTKPGNTMIPPGHFQLLYLLC